MLSAERIGTKVTLTVVRSGRELQVEAVPAELDTRSV